MDQNVILNSLVAHLDILSAMQVSMLIVGLTAIYMLLADGKEISLAGIKVQRPHAVVLVPLLYILIELAVTLCFIRMEALVRLLANDQIPTAFTQITTRAWLLNPFTYFGEPFILQTWLAVTGLCLTWWLGLLAIVALQDNENDSDWSSFILFKYVKFLQVFEQFRYQLGGVFVALGLLGFAAGANTFQVLLERAADITTFEYSTWSGIVFGGLVIGLVVSLPSILLINSYVKTLRERKQAESRTAAESPDKT